MAPNVNIGWKSVYHSIYKYVFRWTWNLFPGICQGVSATSLQQDILVKYEVKRIHESIVEYVCLRFDAGKLDAAYRFLLIFCKGVEADRDIKNACVLATGHWYLPYLTPWWKPLGLLAVVLSGLDFLPLKAVVVTLLHRANLDPTH